MPIPTLYCEDCETALTVVPVDLDEPLCPSCASNRAEAAYERQQQRDLEDPPQTLREQQLAAFRIKHGKRT